MWITTVVDQDPPLLAASTTDGTNVSTLFAIWILGCFRFAYLLVLFHCLNYQPSLIFRSKKLIFSSALIFRLSPTYVRYTQKIYFSVCYSFTTTSLNINTYNYLNMFHLCSCSITTYIFVPCSLKLDWSCTFSVKCVEDIAWHIWALIWAREANFARLNQINCFNLEAKLILFNCRLRCLRSSTINYCAVFRVASFVNGIYAVVVFDYQLERNQSQLISAIPK